MYEHHNAIGSHQIIWAINLDQRDKFIRENIAAKDNNSLLEAAAEKMC